MHTVLALHRNGEKPTITSHDEFESLKMEQAYQRYKSKRKEKPWLTTVPQSVKPSRAYYDLCDFVGVPREMPKKKIKIKTEPLLKLPEIPNDRSSVHEYKGQKNNNTSTCSINKD
ncbi:hypothetical protein [Staphylococcus chromogenes]|uniref:hypothetical protein n=1 Tax=Staphylococcus chromogenes TaxID=46126 RepID=UPI002884287F|nr:hypothetical protein [Staphylococcus chromogenes]MDT0672839.1 hypothetical protein [Staphylococcus chromogenes]